MKINGNSIFRRINILLCSAASLWVALGASLAPANAGPYMGWSSWSLQATSYAGYGSTWLTEWQMEVQSNELKATLQPYGYNYFNIDSGWSDASDSYGRPTPNLTTFPDGIPWISNIVHNNGQKLGIYWIPGVGTDVYDANPPIYGTSYHVDDIVAQPLQAGDAFGSWHLKIDFTKPGAQAYINSVVNQFASWGVDFIKLDSVCPGSGITNLSVDDRPDVQAYWTAIQQCGRPIWLTISWDIDPSYSSTWLAYSSARRIDNDVDLYGPTLTGWSQISWRFTDAVPWAPMSGGGNGWMDLDSLDVGNGTMDGLTTDERKTATTFWALECSPLYTGDDLYHLDSYGLSLLENRNVIAVDQAGHVAKQIQGGNSQIWAANNGDGSYTVGLFNLSGGTATVTANWSSLGLGAVCDVTDLWANSDLGDFTTGFGATLNTHASRLIKVRSVGASCTTKPGTPGTPSASGTTSTSTNLSWTAVTAPANCTIGSYTVYKGGASIGTTAGTTFAATGLSASTTYAFTVAATDADGTGTASAALNVKTLAGGCTTKPSAPTGLASSGATSSTTNLSWTAVSPPTGCAISNYSVYKNGASIGTTTSTTYAVTGLTASTTYTFTVAATDTDGTGALSPGLNVTTSAAGGCTGIAAWSGNSVAYAVGNLVTYNGSEYKCAQAHTSQAGWDPPAVPALWSLVGSC